MSRAISVNHADYRCDAAACGYPAPAESVQVVVDSLLGEI